MYEGSLEAQYPLTLAQRLCKNNQQSLRLGNQVTSTLQEIYLGYMDSARNETNGAYTLSFLIMLTSPSHLAIFVYDWTPSTDVSAQDLWSSCARNTGIAFCLCLEEFYEQHVRAMDDCRHYKGFCDSNPLFITFSVQTLQTSSTITTLWYAVKHHTWDIGYWFAMWFLAVQDSARTYKFKSELHSHTSRSAPDQMIPRDGLGGGAPVRMSSTTKGKTKKHQHESEGAGASKKRVGASLRLGYQEFREGIAWKFTERARICTLIKAVMNICTTVYVY